MFQVALLVNNSDKYTKLEYILVPLIQANIILLLFFSDRNHVAPNDLVKVY